MALPIAIAFVLALGLHLRLLYRSPPPARHAAAGNASVTFRVIRQGAPAAVLPPAVVPDASPPARPARELNSQPVVANAGSAVVSAVSGRIAASSPAVAASISIESGRFSVGRLLEQVGMPLERGNDVPERVFTGLNPLPPAPDYLTAQQFDSGPLPQGDIAPVYPASAEGRAGSVVLRLLIGADGTVDNAAVIQASPADAFDATALAAFIGARFAPATLHGAPVKSQITIEVQFAPDEASPFPADRR